MQQTHSVGGAGFFIPFFIFSPSLSLHSWIKSTFLRVSKVAFIYNPTWIGIIWSPQNRVFYELLSPMMMDVQGPVKEFI